MIEFRQVLIDGNQFYECKNCGALIRDPQLHLDWHNKIISDLNRQVVDDQEEELSG